MRVPLAEAIEGQYLSDAHGQLTRGVSHSSARPMDSPASLDRYLHRGITKEEEHMTDHKVATQQEWQAARDELLQREKDHTRVGDELARQRRELPWVRVETDYRFETSEGTRTLA